jgi:eukaryotic-like serine/threonine-protein kinase
MIGRTILGRYEIQRLLGEGGMGRVYLAKQTDLGRQVVVKVMHEHIAKDAKFRERFQRETLLMARFQHPYAVTLYDAALNNDDGSCIVMEYVKGGNLEKLLEKLKKMSAPRVVRLMIQLCEVLQAAHDEGIIHRDLKPANLMLVDPDTPKERIKVMDFGLAKLIDDGELQRVTDTSVDFAVGTPAYICPEQVRGEAMDHRGDLYSVGVMAFELLAGRVPFKGNSGMDVLLAHATEDPPTFAALGMGSWVPKSVEGVIRKCLAKDPDDRQQSAKELGDEFADALRVAQEVSESKMRLKALPVDTSPSGEEVFALTPVPGEPPRGMSSGVAAVPASRSPAGTASGTRLALAEPGTPLLVSAAAPDPAAVAGLPFRMEAWMPESIALMKLKGYVQDCDGAVLESSPGLVRVRMGKAHWFGRKANGPIEVHLQFTNPDPKRPNQLLIHVVCHPSHPSLLADPVWRERCSTLFIQLRSYLMGGIGN